jgi:hypothetical protein
MSEEFFSLPSQEIFSTNLTSKSNEEGSDSGQVKYNVLEFFYVIILINKEIELFFKNLNIQNERSCKKSADQLQN